MKTLKAIKILDHRGIVDRLNEGGGMWNVYEVIAEMDDGSVLPGSCQGDTHNWALETFEPS
jgi:hypothetical protein